MNPKDIVVGMGIVTVSHLLTNNGLGRISVHPNLVRARRADMPGVVTVAVAGTGKMVWNIRHKNGTAAVYTPDEFNPPPSS